MNAVFLEEFGKENMNAGYKARKDVCDIINSLGVAGSIDVSFSIQDSKGKAYKLAMYMGLAIKLASLKRGSVIIVQYPCRQIAKLLQYYKNKFDVIAIIHDVEGLRYQDPRQLEADVKFFNICKTLISHNKHMTEKLKQCGVLQPEFVELELFDYLCKLRSNKNCEQGICFAGNIDKSVFLKKLPNKVAQCGFNLYGVGTDNFAFPSGINYCGAYDSLSIVEELQGKFALIWDGDSVDTCSGQVGEYIKYNNPHKLSLYIAAGIPVIVWQKAAISDFVKEHNIGISVESLLQIPLVIEGIGESEYMKMKENIVKLQLRVINGDFLKAALNEALHR